MNPLATITALAERSLALLAQRNGFSFDVEACSPSRDWDTGSERSSQSINEAQLLPSRMRDKTGLHFTEIMEGHVHMGREVQDFTTAEKVARGTASSARIYLTVEIATGTKCERTITVYIGQIANNSLSQLVRRHVILPLLQAPFLTHPSHKTLFESVKEKWSSSVKTNQYQMEQLLTTSLN